MLGAEEKSSTCSQGGQSLQESGQVLAGAGSDTPGDSTNPLLSCDHHQGWSPEPHTKWTQLLFGGHFTEISQSSEGCATDTKPGLKLAFPLPFLRHCRALPYSLLLFVQALINHFRQLNYPQNGIFFLNGWVLNIFFPEPSNTQWHKSQCSTRQEHRAGSRWEKQTLKTWFISVYVFIYTKNLIKMISHQTVKWKLIFLKIIVKLIVEGFKSKQKTLCLQSTKKKKINLFASGIAWGPW